MEKVLIRLQGNKIRHSSNLGWGRAVRLSLALVSGAAIAMGQISPSAYRVLGQPDLTRNGLNRVAGVEMASPGGVAVDPRGGATRIYVADTANNRILVWGNAQTFQIGDVPSAVLGQYSLEMSTPLGSGPGGLRSPSGIAVHPATGDVWVADTGNHRVLRFTDPLGAGTRAEADAVIGQNDMNGQLPVGSGDPRSGLRSPASLAFDNSGNLWVADTGNHRVLRFPAGSLNSAMPAADIVIGQRVFTDVGRNRTGAAASSGGFDSPSGLAFDSEGNLYVADTGNARVMRFTPPFSPDSTGSIAASFSAGGQTSGTPGGISVSRGSLYVALPREHRVVVVPASATQATPSSVLGQPDLNGREANNGAQPRAAAFTLSDPADVKTDADGNVYIADTGNHRVLRFGPNSRSADRVWGQLDFSANGANQVEAGGLNRPSKVLVDYTRTPFALYVSDTNNNRILIWKDSTRFRSGDPADSAIGQPDLSSAFTNGGAAGRRASASSLSAPKGIALDAAGDLWVADSGNNRVLRFRRPADASTGDIAADLVLGQPDFTSSAAGATNASSLRVPVAVALSPDGNIFVSDSGNNRILEFGAGANSFAAAIRVYGQPNFFSSMGPRTVSAQTLTQPAGIAVDAAANLYVADAGANRVLIYPNTRDAAESSNAAALVIGSDRFDRINQGGGASRLNAPADVALDSSGRIYVADMNNNRVAVFPSLIFLPITDASMTEVMGQNDFAGVTSNWNSRDGSPTAQSMSAPAGIFVDRQDTVYVADGGNHRVTHHLKAWQVTHAAYVQASSLARGGLVRIEGTGLAGESADATAPMPLSLANREVVVDDSIRAPILSVSPSAMSVQLPSNAPSGSPRLALRLADTGELIAGGRVSVATYAPGLYTRVVNQSGAAITDSNPALRGSIVKLTGTGQGPVSPAVSDGEAAPEGTVKTIAVPTSDGNACLTRQPSVCVAVGTTFAEVRFSGLSAGQVGVWELEIRVPENAPTGTVGVRAVINAVPSNIISIPIR